MKKKFNKLNYNKRSSTSDLYKIAESIGLKNLIIIRKKDLNNYIDKYENIIINLDDLGFGTHWCAINTKKKLYFDSYGLAPPDIIPKSYKYSKKKIELQNLESEICGQLSVLYLWYLNNKSESEFYKEFKDVYKNV